LGKKETPWYAKALAGLAIVYALSPIDLIPDFIPVLGYLDDVIILPLLVALAVKSIPPEVIIRCRDEVIKPADGITEGSDYSRSTARKRWFYAIPVVALQLFVLILQAKRNI
jgi:hypothetical protein